MRARNLRIKALAHLEMMRPYTMFHSGLVALAGVELASQGHAAVWRSVLAALVTMCGWEAGLYAGDYFDRDLDARSKPDRAIPSGRVSPREAFSTMVALILAGYACALALGPANLVLALVTTALGIAYARTFKAMAILGNFDRGVLGICAALFGAFAGGAVLRPAVLLLLVVVFFHDSATNLVGAIRDVDGDRAANCSTVPVVYGVGRAVAIVTILVLCQVVASLALLATVPVTPVAAILFACALLFDGVVYIPLWRAGAALLRPQALTAHKVLVAERLVLMSAFIAVYVPPAVALGVLVATLAVTLGSQWVLRDRYERQRIAPPALGPGYSRG
ncbi:MAG TPA: UbiA family prenyltransferase [Chloroflexota bacterium]|jgi:4-hydroxybenzoate polyprenyltransferase/geranylgeranylglycerol-phosphate geranylgeranyltransferase|nr:UbiA family prenyltransferase [Chloroflexota bacterium]